MDTRSDTRRQWRRRIRKRSIEKWWRQGKSAIAGTVVIGIIITLLVIIPTDGKDQDNTLIQVPEERYYMSDDYYYTNYEDYEETCRQRDEYYRQQAEESAREVEALERARVEMEEAAQREAEMQLKFSRAYYNYPEPFNAPPITWYEEDLIGFRYYQIPAEYEREGGYFPDITQEYLWVICKEKNIDFVTMIALYEGESGYHFDVIGKAGDSGYGQIVPSSNKELLEKLEVTDILNPYQNILVSCTIMEWLLNEYDGSYEKALTAYNAGTGGAYKRYFSAGVDASPYAKGILKKADRIRKEINDAAED